MDGIADVRMTYAAAVSNPNANGTCDDDQFSIGAGWGGSPSICGVNTGSDYRATSTNDCVCESGYVTTTIDFLNGFGSTAGDFNFDWTSMNGNVEAYEFGFGFVTAATDNMGNPIAGLNSASLVSGLNTYCNADYTAGTRASDYVLTSGVGVFNNQPDELNATPNICPNEDTDSGSGPNSSTDAGGLSGLADTDIVTQVVVVYGYSNSPGTDCDGDGDTGVGGSPAGSFTSLIACPPANPLPVELSSFEGKSNSGNNQLFWTTASELNFSHFEVERSKDNLEFESLGKVSSQGSSTMSTSYNFVDSRPHGISFYRLRSIDLDGSFEYSDTIELAQNLAFRIVSLYPSTIQESMTVELELVEREELEFRVIDLLGKVYSEKSKIGHAGSNSFHFDVSDLSSGIYFLEVGNGRNSTVSKFAKN